MTDLPKPRGRLGDAVLGALRELPRAVPRIDVAPESPDDAALTLWVLHELSYGGFSDVDDGAEREPGLLGVRRRLEDELEANLRARWPGVPDGVELESGFFDWLAGHDGPSLARHVQTEATEEQVLDLLRVRSVYHLKEADPTTWTVPRLPAAAKAALVELLYDEYGVGDPVRLHAELFARGMEASGLRPEYGSYVDEAPLEVLEQNNAVSMFGIQRRLRGAAVGHLAAFEMTSSLPNRRYANALRRLGFGPRATDFFDEHVEADAVHENVAAVDLAGGLARLEPALAGHVVWGARALVELEARWAQHLLDAWEAGRSSLLAQQMPELAA